MATIQENLNKIKQAVLGIEVRDAIHDSIEQCYNDVSNSETLADAAVSRANSAAQNAESKAASAQSAASAANAATEKANSAATSATEGVSKVNAAVEDAEAATQAANTAAQNANEKATLAGQHASAADTAAKNANEKATLASDAASAAETATQDANEAAEAANAAAAKAEASSQKADTSAAKADASSLKADTSASNADEKAQIAQNAADNIGDSAQRAEDAATAANEAAENANTQADLALKNATAADTAAQSANSAAQSANSAAENATQQASAANQSALRAETASDSATKAAQNANSVAEQVSSSLERVEGAIDTAQSAADSASELVTRAETLMENAQSSIDSANEAASSARKAAEDTVSARQACETASSKANEAADSANASASTADSKAALATEAANNANGVVRDAKDATQRANNAADNAENLAEQLSSALDRADATISDANVAISEANKSTSDAQAATQECSDTTNAAKEAIAECNKHMDDLPTVRWFAGTALTGQEPEAKPFPESSLPYSHDGDMYLNTDTSDIYRCMSAGTADLATWAWQTNIRGLVFTPSVDEDGNISWSNNGTLDNPETKNIRGPQGFYFTPSVTEEGVLSWTNNGELENPDDVNLKGPQGEPGKAPRVGQNGYWEVWDNESQDWTPTNVFALPARILKGEIPLEGWSEDGSGWAKTTISLEGIDPKCALIADLIQNGEKEHDEPLEIGWLLLTRMFATESQIEIWAREIPEIALPFQLFVIDTRENAGTGEIMLMRRGGSGINTKSLEDAVVQLDHSSWTYDGSEHCPVVTSVTLKGEKLVEKQDYVCLYVPATDAGQYSLEILGVRDYGGSVVTASWSIEKATGSVSLSSQSVTVKGVMGTKNSTITVTKPELCKITAESLNPEFATAEIIDGNKVQVTSVKAGQAQVVVKTNDTYFTEAQTTLTVIVQKADGSISVQPTEITIQGEAGTTGEVTLEFTGNGEISVSQSQYVSASRTDKKLTLTSVEAGTDTLTISIAETEDYTGASCRLQITVQFRPPVSDTFADNDWDTIEQVCYLGEAQDHWNLGDKKIGKRNGVTYQWTIGDFNHYDLAKSDKYYNDPKYNKGTKKANMVLIQEEVFTDNHRMDETNSNACSWKDSEFRTDTLMTIKSELDQDFVAVVRKVVIKTAQSGNDATIVETEDDFFMMSEVEVFGNNDHSKPGEGTYLQYFQAGNSRIKYQSGSAKWYWLRSPYSGSSDIFLRVDSRGSWHTINAAYTSGGVVLCVCI